MPDSWGGYTTAKRGGKRKACTGIVAVPNSMLHNEILSGNAGGAQVGLTSAWNFRVVRTHEVYPERENYSLLALTGYMIRALSGSMK